MPVNAGNSVGIAFEEQRLAGKLAASLAWPQQRNTTSDNPHRLGVQTLSIELDERKKNDRKRRARVYQYNYHTNQSRLVLVDLEKATIINQQIIDSVHLPLNSAEISMAKSLVEQQSEIMDKLNQSRQRRGLPQVNNLSTIDVKASIFEPGNGQHNCATERCAHVSLFDQTRIVFSIEPIVNLQSLSVSTLRQSL